MSTSSEIVEFLGCVGLPYIGGILGSLVVVKNLPWYDSLNKPFFTVPPWIFGPAWGILYGVIGLASYFVLRQRRNGSSIVLPAILYLVQLLLNWSWVPVFFGLHQITAVGYKQLKSMTVLLRSFIFFFQFKGDWNYCCSHGFGCIHCNFISHSQWGCWMALCSLFDLAYLRFGPEHCNWHFESDSIKRLFWTDRKAMSNKKSLSYTVFSLLSCLNFKKTAKIAFFDLLLCFIK